MSTKHQKVVERARRDPSARFNSLAHLMDVEALRRAFRRISRNAAVGVDGVSKEEYAQDLGNNLKDLHRRLKEGTYRHQAIRRVEIPKAGGKTRPIGISCVEDKIVQGALKEVLETIYEQDFMPSSYGFRPRRGAHDALRAVDRMIHKEGIRWIVEADIQSFFDKIDRKHLREMLQIRVADGAVMRLLGKCLQVGVLNGEKFTRPEEGTVQGSIISPLLGNVYLHYTLDQWFEREVRPRLRGKARLIRYADDFVLGFERREEAEKVMAVLHKRMARMGLTLHPDKTRLVDFRGPRQAAKSGKGASTFDFLGFTIHWGRTRKGRWIPQMKTRKASLRKAITAFSEYCRSHRHDPLQEQHAALNRRLRGHFNYFGVTGNGRAMSRLHFRVRRVWYKWLRRRGQRKPINWERFNVYLRRFPLLQPQIRTRLWEKSP